MPFGSEAAEDEVDPFCSPGGEYDFFGFGSEIGSGLAARLKKAAARLLAEPMDAGRISRRAAEIGQHCFEDPRVDRRRRVVVEINPFHFRSQIES